MNNRLDHPPRKVTIATVLQAVAGTLAARLAWLEELVRAAGRTDLIVFPEEALQSGRDGTAAERALVLAGELVGRLGTLAREHHTYLVVPMLLAENTLVSNAAVVLDRSGQVTGIYRKVHPVAAPDNTLEGGVTPGAGYPVFDCDFGKLGVQICWDMSYEDGWQALARQGAEIVAVPSASPQTTIGRMIRELGLEEMPDRIERSRRLQDAARRHPPRSS